MLRAWIGILVAVGVVLVALSSRTPTQGAGYFESFDGIDPSSPMVVYGDGLFAYDLQDRNNAPDMTDTVGEHTADCGAPPATHPLEGPKDHIYICRQHMMTSLGDSGYGATNDFVVGYSVADERPHLCSSHQDRTISC